MDAESNHHLVLACPYTQCVWRYLEEKLKINNLWSGESVSDCLKTWCLNLEVKHIKFLPIIALWFIWKARNLSCFEDTLMTPFQVATFSLGMLRSFPQDNLVVKIRNIVVENIDKTYPWGYFDGSVAGDPKLCGAGGMIYFYDEHYFSFKAGLVTGTNNFTEICALKLLLTFAREKHIVKFQIFGDSELVIN